MLYPANYFNLAVLLTIPLILWRIYLLCSDIHHADMANYYCYYYSNVFICIEPSKLMRVSSKHVVDVHQQRPMLGMCYYPC